MRARTLGAVRLMVAVSIGIGSVAIGSVHSTAAQSPRSAIGSRTDPQLRDEVDRALTHRINGLHDPLLSVEVLTRMAEGSMPKRLEISVDKVGDVYVDPADVLHIRYKSVMDEPRGIGPQHAHAITQ